MKYTKCDLCEMDGTIKPAIGKYIADDDNLYYVCSKCAKLAEEEGFSVKPLT